VPFGPDYIDTACLRFLRARQGVVSVALEMMEQCLDLRKREQIDTILSRPLPKVVLEHIHACYDEGWLPSPDKSGRPVYILVGGRTGERLGKLFTPPVEGMPWELADVMEAFLHWHLQMMEYLSKVVYAKLTRRAGRLVNKFVMIDDLSGMSTQGVTQIMKFVDIMKKMSEIDQLLYPEGLGCMYFCNAPWLFSAPWKVRLASCQPFRPFQGSQSHYDASGPKHSAPCVLPGHLVLHDRGDDEADARGERGGHAQDPEAVPARGGAA
jgi:hypothetical protein